MPPPSSSSSPFHGMALRRLPRACAVSAGAVLGVVALRVALTGSRAKQTSLCLFWCLRGTSTPHRPHADVPRRRRRVVGLSSFPYQAARLLSTVRARCGCPRTRVRGVTQGTASLVMMMMMGGGKLENPGGDKAEGERGGAAVEREWLRWAPLVLSASPAVDVTAAAADPPSPRLCPFPCLSFPPHLCASVTMSRGDSLPAATSHFCSPPRLGTSSRLLFSLPPAPLPAHTHTLTPAAGNVAHDLKDA